MTSSPGVFKREAFFEVRRFEGDHFFIESRRAEVRDCVRRDLRFRLAQMPASTHI